MSDRGEAEVTVLIPTWNRCALLRRCLESLSRQTAPHRILVVDNGSSDDTRAVLAEDFPAVEVLALEHNLGFAAAVNRGLKQIDTPFVALLNNDTEADPAWIETGLEVFRRHPETWLLASLMLDFFARDVVDSAGDCYTITGMPLKRGHGEAAGGYSEPGEVLGASGGAAFYRRDLFDRIGFFDESYYMYLEDVDLSLRARLAGYRCRFAPGARVFHVEAASDPARRPGATGATETFYSTARVYWITRNRWLLMMTYQPLRCLPWLLYGWTRSFFFHLLKAGHWVSFVRGLAAGAAATPRALGKRRQLGRQRTLSNGELWRLLREC